MDWDNVIADVDMILPCHYNVGRSAAIDKIVLHHNAGTLSIEDCYNVWQNREASAHYQVDINGRVGQLVNDGDTAWHAGNANPSSIGIEHANDNEDPWTISEDTLESGSHLVAALCKMYGLGEPQWESNVYPHSYFMATECPGEIAGSQNGQYMDRARYWYACMMGHSGSVNSARSIQIWPSNGSDAQKWIPEHHEDGSVSLRNVACGKYLDVMGAGTESGTPCRVYPGNDTDAQKWLLIEKPGDYVPSYNRPVALVPKVNQSLRLDVRGGGDVQGTGIHVYDLNDTPAQQWYVMDSGDGTWTLLNNSQGAKLALDVVSGGA